MYLQAIVLIVPCLMFLAGCSGRQHVSMQQKNSLQTICLVPSQADTVAGPMRIVSDAQVTYLERPIDSNKGKPMGKGAPGAGYASFSFECPVTGTYTFFGNFYWVDGGSNSFWIKVDTMDYAMFGNDGQEGKWIFYPGFVTTLEKGPHTVLVQEREWGARLASLIITHAPEYVTYESVFKDSGFVARDSVALLVYPGISVDSAISFSLFYANNNKPHGSAVSCVVSNSSGKTIYSGSLTEGQEGFCTIDPPVDGIYTITVDGRSATYERVYDRLRKIRDEFARFKQRTDLTDPERFWLPTLHLCMENIERGWYVEHTLDTKRLVMPEYVHQELDFAEKIVTAFEKLNFAALTKPGVREMAFYSAGDDTLCPYRLYMPEAYFIRPQEKFPLVLFLHGLDNTQYQFERDARFYKRSMNELLVPAVMPWGRGNYHYIDVVEKDLVQMVRSLVAYYNFDSTRLAVAGFSMGGMGTWNLVYDYPGMFDAAVPGAGALTWEFNDKVKAKKLPEQLPRTIVILHSPEDKTISYSLALSAAAHLKTRKHPYTFITYEGGHVSYPKLIEVLNGLWQD